MAGHPVVYTLDASVAFNLHAGQILDRALRLPFAYQVADLMLAEYEDDTCRAVVEHSAAVVWLSSSEMREVDLLASAEPRALRQV